MQRVYKGAAAVAATVVAVGFGSVAGAQDYPPNATTPTTITSGGAGERDPGELPATGSDDADVVRLAGGAVLTGLGLLAAARVRRAAH